MKRRKKPNWQKSGWRGLSHFGKLALLLRIVIRGFLPWMGIALLVWIGVEMLIEFTSYVDQVPESITKQRSTLDQNFFNP